MQLNVVLTRPARLRAVAALAALVGGAFLLSASAGSAAGGAKPPVPAQPERPLKADRNNDKIFDDLEARIAASPAEARVDAIVRLARPASAENLRELGGQAGAFSATHRFTVVPAFAASLTKGQLQALTRVPWVVSVEENSRVRALNNSAQESFGVTKARADAPALDGSADGNAAAYSAGDLVAAVIDTGIDAAHLDLDEGKVLAFKDFVNGRTTAYDDNGHGTHVAATIAGDGDARADRLHAGVAPAAGLVGVKVLDANGGGSMADVTAAIDWVVQNKDVYGIEAINLSLGASGCADGTDVTSVAVDNAAAAGLVVAVAAGNEGPGTCTVGSPGAAARGLTVGAMADLGAGGFALASFSSRGKTADGRVKPNLVAPGVGITSAQANTTSGYVANNGTSMATPFIAGVALLMKDANGALTAQQIVDQLVATAADWGPAGADGEYGAGRLDGFAALKAAGAQLGTAPAMPAHEFRAGSLAATGAYADYSFSVTDTRFPIAATLTISSLSTGASYSPDFDLYLYNPSGSLVAWSERVERQEDVAFTPTATGTYRIRVASYNGGGAYFVDVSAGLGTSTAPAPAPAPTTVAAAPTAVTLYAGSVRSGGAGQLGADDGAYFQVNSTTSYTRQTDWYGRIGGVANGLRSLKVNYSGLNSVSCDQRIFVYNWTTGAWTRLDARTVGSTEVALSLPVSGTLAEYVSGSTGDGEVAVRVRCLRDGVNFFSSADLLQIVYEK